MAKKLPSMIVGWQEWVSLPELGLPAVKAKIDTGAKTSSLHAYHIEKFTQRGQPYVRFEVHPIQRNRVVTRLCEAPVIDKRTVKSSSGDKEKRPVIKTQLLLGDVQWEIELNLTNRDTMGFRMLLGREALKHMLVNPKHTCLHGKISPQDINLKYIN